MDYVAEIPAITRQKWLSALAVDETELLTIEDSQKVVARFGADFETELAKLPNYLEAPRAAWERVILRIIEDEPVCITPNQNREEIIRELSRVVGVRLEKVEKQFELIETKTALKALHYCETLWQQLRAGDFEAIRQWNLHTEGSSIWFGKSRKFHPEPTAGNEEPNPPVKPKKPSQRFLALWYFYLQSAGIEPEFGTDGKTKKSAVKEVGRKFNVSPNRFEQVYNLVSTSKDERTEPAYLKDLEKVVLELGKDSNHVSALDLANLELETAKTRKGRKK